MIEKVPFSDWAAPIVVVPKKDGRIRICGDIRLRVIHSVCIACMVLKVLVNHKWKRSAVFQRPT